MLITVIACAYVAAGSAIEARTDVRLLLLSVEVWEPATLVDIAALREPASGGMTCSVRDLLV
jgi:hypothetical protein